MRQPGAYHPGVLRHVGRGDFQVLVERLAKSRMPIREPAAVGLGEQPAERCVGGGLVEAGLPEEAFLAGNRVDSGVDLYSKRAARQLLYVTPAGLGRKGAIDRSGLSGPQSGPHIRTKLFDLRS